MEYVYSTEPLVTMYQYTGLGSMIPVFLIGLICAFFMALLALSIGQNPKTVSVTVLATFCAFPMYWVYQTQHQEPMPNIPVVGTIDSWSESTEMVRISKHKTEPQWRGYMIYRVDDVRYPVKITPGQQLPERAIFYKNPRHLAKP